MFDNTNPEGDQRIRTWLVQRPTLTLWMVGAFVAVLIVLFLASAHHAGVPMITPGKKPTPLSQASIDAVKHDVHAVESWAHASAATRQAEANG